MTKKYDIVIVGAGLAGLSAALELEKFELKTLVLEKSDRAGGRMKTDVEDGFHFDRGFQVLLTAYPDAAQVLDYEALDLCRFKPGALCFNELKKFEVEDTGRHPTALPKMAFSPVGSLTDKLKVGNLAARLRNTSIDEIFERPEHTTLDYLRQQHFSEKIIDRFFRPFFSGIFLEPNLETSSRMFEFVFKMFAEGDAAVPARGMEEIPRQMKSKLKRTEFRFHTPVKRVSDGEVELGDGEVIHSDIVILATEPDGIVPRMTSHMPWHSTACYYFEAPENVLPHKMIAVSFRENALVNNLTVISDTAPGYAPKNRHLVSVNLLRLPDRSVEEISQMIKNELALTFGNSVQSWKFLKNYHIRKALPVPDSMAHSASIEATRIKEGVFLAGDQMLNPSINAAIRSGEKAAQAAVLHFNVNQE